MTTLKLPGLCRPLLLAAGYGREDVVSFLLSVGVDPMARSFGGRHALFESALRNFPAVVALLIADARVDVNAPGHDVRYGHIRVSFS
jgi:ankyrin repeat protein